MSRESYLTLNKASGPNSNTRTEPFVKVIAVVATLGGLLFGYDTGVISGALLFMGPELNLTPFTTGLVTSSLLFGAAFGALLSGHFAAAAGRKKIILVLAIIFAIGALGTSMAPDVEWMIFFRLVLGVAVGGAAATVPVYIAEIAPANRRGQLVTLQELMIVSGQMLAYISNAGFNAAWGGETTWRWMLAVATLPAVLLFFGMMFMPDTPRWYAMKGRLAEARKVLERTRAPQDVDWELTEIEETLTEEAQQRPRLRELRKPWLFKLFLIGMGIAVIQQLTGVNTIMYYAPTMLKAVGMDDSAALFATIANGAISVVMTLVGIWLLGKMGRRAMTMLGQFGCTACLVFIGAVTFFMPETVNGQPDMWRSYMVLLGMLMFLSFQQGALSPVTWLLLSEIFPTRLRGIFMGGAVFAMWIANFLISLMFPVLLASVGLAGAFFIFALVGIAGAIFVIKCVPETRNRSLEQIEHYLHETLSHDEEPAPKPLGRPVNKTS
ncbi:MULTISPECIES: sugar porter family MFS transporter [Pantoea]|jgi:major inositol transporter-like SP family MFS transporter|uniref:sugar porter family MFS transporter n=1 Tax=Pantoea TaxID=53335 RepID=UPI000EA2A6A3|nr:MULTISPECIES: sugar porter family MFS transporter [Pantoea]HCX00471.1 MFS transporter [Pantoea sp.]MBZ6386675.1 sugar porter family MFS transporter [Pantoea piersonii]MBZ6399655.1 sugar porter family MFS transporter [Pantoea piersonii]MBZ6407147.1 sugar porter family MFS transporter [Pantoea piersonii]MBZ6425828.1 sugar porter family MFS transporter [Pantoea piersonii]